MSLNARNSHSDLRATTNKRIGGKKQAADDPLLLTPNALVQCISQMGYPNFTVDDIMKPNPNSTQHLFEWMLDHFLAVSREVIEPGLHAAAENVEYPEFQTDARAMVAFMRSMNYVMTSANINDFSFSDILKPEPQRLIQILSYIINLERFREDKSVLDAINQQLNASEGIKKRHGELFYQNSILAERVANIRSTRETDEAKLQKVTEANERSMEELRAFQKKQVALAADIDKIKAEKANLAQRLQQCAEMKVSLTQDCERIKRYIVDSPEKLQQVINDIGLSLTADKVAVDALERKGRAYKTSGDSFAVVEQDVNACIKVMEECASDILKEEEDLRKLQRLKDTLNQRNRDVKEIMRKEEMLQRQLKSAKEKIEKAQQAQQLKTAEAKAKMVELREVYRGLSEQRNKRSEEMESKKRQIERVEKRIADLRETVDAEVRHTQQEYQKLNAHIMLYITEMEKLM